MKRQLSRKHLPLQPRLWTSNLLLFFVVSSLILHPSSLLAADWPVFRGNPLQTGVAPAALPDQLEVRWRFKTKDSIEGTAAIANHVVYVGSFDEHLYALDLGAGTLKWKYKAGLIKTSVGVRGDTVYAGNADGVVHAVNAADGTKRWSYDTQTEITSGISFAGENILFGSGDETLYCLSRDGKERWKFKVPGGPVMGTPAVVDGRTFAAGCDSTLHVLNTADGKEVAGTVDLGGQVGATVAVAGNELYVGTMSNEVLAVDWKKGEVLWRFEAAQRPQAFFASPAVRDQLVVAASRDKRVHALERKTGKEVWSFATDKKVDSSPVIAGDRVYVGSFDGSLYVLDLRQGKPLQKLELGSPITASGAVADNCLVIGASDGTLFCLGAKK
jgi:outer membrane protein assembly factor BamB